MQCLTKARFSSLFSRQPRAKGGRRLTSMKTGQTALAVFKTTHWTVVLHAANRNADNGGEAFAQLYLAYWRPLYAYARRRGYLPGDAEDIIQDFFLRLIRKDSL